MPEWQLIIPILLFGLVALPGMFVAGYRAALRKIDANPATIRRVYLLRLVAFEGVFFPQMSGHTWPSGTFPWRNALGVAIVISALFGATLMAISLWIEWRERRRGRWRVRISPPSGERAAP